MIVRKTNYIDFLAGSRESARASANVERGQGEGVHFRPLSPDNSVAAPKHGSVGAQLRDHLGNQVAKRERVVFIDVGGGVVARFIHFSFNHEGEIANAR